MRMKLLSAWVVVTLLQVCACLQASAESQPERVLFVGNSFTYYNDGIHKHYGNLLRAAQLNTSSTRNRMLTYSGGGLWEFPAALESALAEEAWDVVIMHDYSNGPLTHWQRFVDSSTKLVDITRGHSVSPMLMMTWAYEGDQEMGTALAQAYSKAGEQLKIPVIPVGLAFTKATHATTINLYTPDLLKYEEGKAVYKKIVKHPSLAGTYLAACTVYATLTGRNPEGLAYTAGLDESDAELLQRVAWQAVQAFAP